MPGKDQFHGRDSENDCDLVLLNRLKEFNRVEFGHDHYRHALVELIHEDVHTAYTDINSCESLLVG